MKKTIALALCLLMALSFASCGSDEGKNDGKISVIDSHGVEITLDEPADVVVSLTPAITETLYVIGAGDTLGAKSTWCNYPAEADDVEVIGDAYTGINIERIIEMGADVVFITGTTAAGATETLAAANIQVCNLEFDTIDDIYTGIEKIGVVVGKKAEADALVQSLKNDLKALQDKCAEGTNRKVFIDWGDLYSSSKVDVFGNLLQTINATNIAYDYDYTSPQLSAEKVIEENPDVYIVTSSEEFFVKPAGFDEINAFKNGEVHYVDYYNPLCDMISRQGPRFVEGLTAVAKMIHPELEF